MRLTLDSALFDVQSAAEAIALVNLLSTAVSDTHAHSLLTNPPYVIGGNNGPIDVWLAGRSSYEADAFRSLLTQGLITAAGVRAEAVSDSARPRRWNLPGPREFRVERRQESDWKRLALTITDAADLLREPVYLVMENARTELAFVRHLAGPTNGATLQTLLNQPGRIVTYGGGGGEARKWVDALIEHAPTPATWRRVLRAWVLFDNDAGDLDAREPSESAVKFMESCERVVSTYGVGLSWICLRRREIESYVPDSGLRAAKTDKQEKFVDLVISWRANPARAPWAWALDLKKGLHGDRHKNWSKGLSELDSNAIKQGKKPLEAQMLKAPFSELSPEDITTLTRGLGDDLGDALRKESNPAWIADLPTEYDRGPADQVPRFSFVQSLFDRM
jgi:hypothetical protein